MFGGFLGNVRGVFGGCLGDVFGMLGGYVGDVFGDVLGDSLGMMFDSIFIFRGC